MKLRPIAIAVRVALLQIIDEYRAREIRRNCCSVCRSLKG